MAQRDIVVIGASAGGVAVLTELVQSLPADFHAAVFIVLHIPPHSPSVLPQILSAAGPLQAVHPVDGERIQKGRIYIASPDHHLLIEDGHVVVRKGPKENRFRPSVDALFRSAAYIYGPRVIGIVLTGTLDDGTSGLWSIKRLGGVAIIQEPKEAPFPSMPANVLEYVDVDYIAPVATMGPLLVRLTGEQANGEPELSEEERKGLETEVRTSIGDNAARLELFENGEFTGFTCPDCFGPLARIKGGGLMRFRCHTGHSFTMNVLLSGVSQRIEETLTCALRSLEEYGALLVHMGKRFEDAGHPHTAGLFFSKAEETAKHIRLVNSSIAQHEHFSGDIHPEPSGPV